MRTADDLRKYCFEICNSRFGNKRDTTRSLRCISELLSPFRGIDWNSLTSDEAYPTNPGDVAREIQSTSEAAVQRAFFFQETTKVGDGRIRWLDAEVPVCPGRNARRRAMDLFGYWISESMADNNRPVVAELKFSTAKSPGAGSPPFALFEALAYGASLFVNRRSNDGNLKGHGQSLDVSVFPDLVVAANRAYWVSWREKLSEDISLLFDLSRELESILSESFKAKPPKIFWAWFADIDFEQQKGDSERYTPVVPADCKGWGILESEQDQQQL